MWSALGVLIIILYTLCDQLSVAVPGASNHFGIRFRLPFIDVNIQNGSKLHIVQDAAGQHVFMVHQLELYLLVVAKGTARLVFVTELDGDLKNSEFLGVELISWGNHVLLVVALEDHLEVYQLSRDMIAYRIMNGANVEVERSFPIQQITLHGTYRGIFLCESTEGSVFLVVLVKFSRYYNRLNTYEWSETYFDPNEERTIAPVRKMKSLGLGSKYLITSRLSKSKALATVVVYSITSTLEQLQVLQFESTLLHVFTYQGDNYMLSCAGRQKKCTFFKMVDEQFVVYKNIPPREAYFDHFTAGEHFLVGQRDVEVSVYLDIGMEYYGSCRTTAMQISNIYTHLNEEGKEYIITVSSKISSTLVQIAEVEYEKGMLREKEPTEFVSTVKYQKTIFQENVKKLRNILLNRKHHFDDMRKALESVRADRRELVFRNPVRLFSAHMGIVKVIGSKLRRPVKILRGIQDLSHGKGHSRFNGVPSRLPRHTEASYSSALYLNIRNLSVNNLIYDGDLIPGIALNMDESVLQFDVPVTTKVLKAADISIGRSCERELNSEEQRVIKTKSIQIDSINGVVWKDFQKDLFMKPRDKVIKGNILFQSDVTIGDLNTRALNERITKNLFNLIEDQNVTSRLFANRVTLNGLQVVKINGLDFALDIARLEQNNFIQSSIVIDDVVVMERLMLTNGDDKARHIFGTSMMDLQQNYTGSVIIEGSLRINKIDIGDKATLLIGDRTMPLNIASAFWMTSLPQVFNNVMFNNCYVSAPALHTLRINGNSITKYLLVSQPVLPPVDMVFSSVQIVGSLISNSDQPTRLRRISEHAVKISEEVVISGNKKFLGKLTFENADIDFLNNLPTSDLVSIDEKVCVFKGTKTFKSVHVSKAVIIDRGLDLMNFQDKFRVHHYFKSVHMNSPINVHSVVFSYFNGLPSNEVFRYFSRTLNTVVLNKDLYVEGSVEFISNLDVRVINNIIWDDYIKSLVQLDENTVIGGTKTILNNLTIGSSINVPLINNIKVTDLLDSVLLKTKNQIIYGAYRLVGAHITNLNVSHFNGLAVNRLIDIRSPEVILNSDILVNKLKTLGNFHGPLNINFDYIKVGIRNSLQKPWKNLRILGNAYWPWGNDTQSFNIQHLFKNAVRQNSEQIITGNVKLRKPLINHMETKDIFPDDIDFDYITSDCLFYNSSVAEIVRAEKWFTRPIKIVEAVAMDLVNPIMLNRVNILEFNSSQYRLSQPILLTKPLHFESSPIFGYLTVDGSINYVYPDQVFYSDGSTFWPPVTIRNLNVQDDLRVLNINQLQLDFILKNRVPLSGGVHDIFGHLTFEDLVLEDHIYLQSINNISLANLVQKNAPEQQMILGHKTILGDLYFNVPTTVQKLNNELMSERYQETLFPEGNHHFEVLSIENAIFENGLLPELATSKTFEQRASTFSFYNETLHKHATNFDITAQSLRNIESVFEAKAMNPRRLLYLEYDFSTSVVWGSTNDSVENEYTFDNHRYQFCDREQTVVKWSRYYNKVFVSKTKSNIITTTKFGMYVIAENKCTESFRHATSYVSVNYIEFTNNFKFDKLVHSIDAICSTNLFLVFHLINYFTGDNEIRIVMVDGNNKIVRDWQTIDEGIGRISKLYNLPTHTILAVSTVVNNYPSITIYIWDVYSQMFELTQVIDGDFDIIEVAQVTPHLYHLFLSCVHCQRIAVFEYDSAEWVSKAPQTHRMYHIFQIIKLKRRIERVSLFSLPDGGIYMLLLPDQDIDFYYVYRYEHIRGWKHLTYGYFKNIQNAYPLIEPGLLSVESNILLLCNRQCTLVKALYQW